MMGRPRKTRALVAEVHLVPVIFAGKRRRYCRRCHLSYWVPRGRGRPALYCPRCAS